MGRKLGVERTFVGAMCKGKSPVSLKTIKKLRKLFPKLNFHWLITGDGEMFFPDVKNYDTSELTEPKPKYLSDDLYDFLKDQIRIKDERIKKLEDHAETRGEQIKDLKKQLNSFTKTTQKNSY
ncbi:MAG: hypothetical protein KAV44_05795 [Bacteroidales bacterium]|nr:hypothetical protein [Bacteroidales bacterium]